MEETLMEPRLLSFIVCIVEAAACAAETFSIWLRSCLCGCVAVIDFQGLFITKSERIFDVGMHEQTGLVEFCAICYSIRSFSLTQPRTKPLKLLRSGRVLIYFDEIIRNWTGGNIENDQNAIMKMDQK